MVTFRVPGRSPGTRGKTAVPGRAPWRAERAAEVPGRAARRAERAAEDAGEAAQHARSARAGLFFSPCLRGARPRATVFPRVPGDRPGTRKVTINYLFVTFKIKLMVTLSQYFP